MLAFSLILVLSTLASQLAEMKGCVRLISGAKNNGEIDLSNVFSLFNMCPKLDPL